MTLHTTSLDSLPQDLYRPSRPDILRFPLNLVCGSRTTRVRRSLLPSSLAAILLFLASLPAFAGQRHTVWAYPPGAGPKGVVEAETWVTASRADSDRGTAAEYRIEIENGLSDDVSLDLYLAVLDQKPGE